VTVEGYNRKIICVLSNMQQKGMLVKKSGINAKDIVLDSASYNATA